MNTTLPDNGQPPKPRKWWKVWLRTLAFGFAALVTLIFLVVSFENWRGRRMWEAYRKEAEGRGVKLDLASMIPPPIPDGSNVAAIPVLKAVLDYDHSPNGEVRWKDPDTYHRVMALQDIVGEALTGVPKPAWDKATLLNLARVEEKLTHPSSKIAPVPKQATPAQTLLLAFAEFDADLKSLDHGFARPQVRFPVHYEELFNALLPHLAALKSFSRVGQFKAAALLAENKPREAVDQVLFSFRCGEVVAAQPLLLSALVQFAVDSQSISAIYQGIVAHQWNPDQLRQFEAVLKSREPFSLMEEAMRLERALANGCYEAWRSGDFDTSDGYGTVRWSPKAVLYQNQVSLNLLYDGFDLGVVRTKGLPAISDDSRLEAIRTGFFPYHALAAMMAPALESAVKKAVRGRVTLDLAILACELERHRLAKGSYPDSLADLVPEFAKAISDDAASKTALHYQRADPDQFVLYSVGSDLKDDQGKPDKNDKGDWVWRWPEAGN